LGLASSAQRFIPEYAGKKQLELLRGFLSGSRWLVLALATGWALIAAAGVWLLGPHLRSYEIFPLYLACATLPLFTVGRAQDGIARSYDWMNLALVPAYIIRPLLLVAVMATAFTLELPTDATTAMLAALATSWATVLAQTVSMNRKLAKVI